jgi:hypothetical protein
MNLQCKRYCSCLHNVQDKNLHDSTLVAYEVYISSDFAPETPNRSNAMPLNDRFVIREPLVCTVRQTPPCLHGGRELFQHLLGVVPVDASISDTNAILQAFFAFFRYLLIACSLC